MGKLSIGEVVKIIRLRAVRAWCCGLGAIFITFALIASPLPNRNPKVMATSAFSAFSENGDLVWMVMPLFILGVALLLCALLISWRLKYVDE